MGAEVSGELRLLVAERAEWRCEYCLLHADDSFTPHQIDHIISRKHGGSSEEANLAYACVRCNAWKGPDIASFGFYPTKIVPLFHPRKDRWEDHFELFGLEIKPLTDTGAATARLLRLNSSSRIAERRALAAARR
jgi:HNH endonuclease